MQEEVVTVDRFIDKFAKRRCRHGCNRYNARTGRLERNAWWAKLTDRLFFTRQSDAWCADCGFYAETVQVAARNTPRNYTQET